MKEDFLHYVWRYKLLITKNLQTVNGESIVIVDIGVFNKDAGPDFLNAQIKINNQLWAGNIEIHCNASDWYVHHHEKDKNYDAVILHLVWNNDAPVFMKNNKPIPTIVLRNYVAKSMLNNYKNLLTTQQRWIACEKQITTVDSFTFNNWLERLYFERLEDKSDVIKTLLLQSNNNYEAVLFCLLAKNFGLKTNGEAFFNLATSLDFSIVRKVHFNRGDLEALLFGQAGFLEENLEVVYYKKLKEDYQYLKHKFGLTPLFNGQFKFFRMRPANFPTIRIAQLVAVFSKHQNLFSKLIQFKKIEDFYALFAVSVSEFWETHYTFKTTSKKTAKKLTKKFIDLLLINTILPLKFTYFKNIGMVNEYDYLSFIKQIKPEKNNIISKFSDLHIETKNAFETQSLLQLKNKYCDFKKCLHCAIGTCLVRKV